MRNKKLYEMIMKICPIELEEANKFITKYHRHNKQFQGYKFSIGVKINDVLVGVAVCGRPVSRYLDNKTILEVTSLCTDGTKNIRLKLYSSCARIAKELGYNEIITYTFKSEFGHSLKATGWVREVDNCGGLNWNCKNRIRTDTVINLFNKEKKYPNELKQRWCKKLN